MRPTLPAHCLSKILVAAIFALSASVHAEETASLEELALLPEYCKYTPAWRLWGKHMDFNPHDPVQEQRLTSIMGTTLQHMHHYCFGLLHTNRYTVFGHRHPDRLHWLSMTIGDFDYVIQRAPADFVLLPEIFTKKGENLIRLGKAPLAIREFQRAIERKPDYWPPYAQLSDLYKNIGDLKKARELLEKGLEFSPDAKALTRRLAEIDAVKDKPKTASGSPRKPAAPERPTQ